MITHVAIRFQGTTYSLPKPNRHHDVIRRIIEVTGVDRVDTQEDDQGFLDEKGQYYRRSQALMHAMLNDQVRSQIRLGMLFSEDLW